MDQHGFTLRPHSDRYWTDIDPSLKKFIFRLLEINPPFDSAFAARQALLKLQLKSAVLKEQEQESTTITSLQPKKSFWRWLLLAILLFLLGIGGYWWINLQRQPAIAKIHQPTICCIADIAAIPQGKFSYTAEKIGIWNYVLQQKNLILKDLTLKTKLADKTPQFQLDYLPDDTQAESISKIQQGKADFGIVSLNDPLDNDLSSEIFAYDGLTVFVAFSDRQGKHNLLQALKGKITFEQLRQLYTVVYPKDNSLPPAGQKFAEILNTDEGQKLLTKTGLIARE